MQATTASISPDINCQLCGHQCFAKRSQGQVGLCGAGQTVGFSSALLHFGEEPPISGYGLVEKGGSGTIFFTRCTLKCVFCQNWQISQVPGGLEMTAEQLAQTMVELQKQGALNINLVSPTPYVAQIVMALNLAKQQGLTIPIVYNSGGYDSLTALRLLDGLIDIYLPDAKIAPPWDMPHGDPDSVSARLLGAGNYPWINQQALLEMFRQVGHLEMDAQGVAYKGLLVRHLVLPDNLARTDQMLVWLREKFGAGLYLSLMAQYHPSHQVKQFNPEFQAFPGLFRPLSIREYEKATNLALDLGLEKSFVQDLEAAANYLPDFDKPDVF